MKKKLLSLFLIFCLALVFGGCKNSDGDKLLLEGAEAYENGDYEAALEKLEAAKEAGISEKHSMSDLYSCLGNTYMELDNMEKAFEYYNAALEDDPDDVRNYTNLAIAYRQNGDTESAKKLYLQAIVLDPDYPELNSSLGTLYLFEGNTTEAIKYFDRAIELDPDLAVAYGNGALAYAMDGDFETADKYLALAREKGYANADQMAEMIEKEKAH